ncbi:MAG: TonB-dependent receptor [Weeksellaceae bacterium]
MHLKQMLCGMLMLFISIIQAQEDSTIIQLDKIKVKAHKEHATIYQAEKVDALTKQSNLGKDLAHQLESLSGVTVRKTGSNIAKPIIDGLSSSRLVYMINGVKLENQDWADAHSPEIDADLASNLDVIRGAETVKYGSNALGGVINANTDKINSNHDFNGTAAIHYTGNTGGWGGRLKLERNSSLINGLRWRLSANNTQNGDYKTAAYNVGNSGSRLESYMGEIEYKYKNIELKSFLYQYDSKQGNYFGSLTGNAEEFEDRIQAGRPGIIKPYAFNIEYPLQQSSHFIANVKADWKFKTNWFLNAQYTFQENDKQEFDARTNSLNRDPVQDMVLSTTHINTQVGFKNYFLNAVLGFQIRDKENITHPEITGVTPVLPNYIYKEKSIFTHHTYSQGLWIINTGLRYDWVKMNARGINFVGQQYGDDKDFSSFSAQFAAQYAPDKWIFNSSISYGWRVPESYELYANGKQHGAPIYFVGDHDLEPEKGFKWVNKIEFDTDHTHTALQGFYNYLENYIYSIPTKGYKLLLSGPAALFQFKQRDAMIYGVDIIQNTALTPRLQMENKFSWLKGEEIDSKLPLPNISPIRLHNHLRYSFSKVGFLRDNAIQLSHDWVAKKKNFNPDYELSTSVPDAYHLFNIAMTSHYVINEDKGLQLTLSIDNIFNTLYKDYLNLHRYFVHDRGRSINVNLQFQF